MEPNERFKKLVEKYKDDPEFEYEGVLLGVSERIAALMNDRGLSRSDVAKALSCSPAYVTKLLRGSENLTLRKLVEVGCAIGARVSIEINLEGRPQLRSKAQTDTYIRRTGKRAIVAEKRGKQK